MNLYHSNNIGNVAVLGHLGSGKTSVIEAMAKRAGISQQIGTISQGTTISDYDVEEIKRQSSINLSLIPLEWDYCKINLLDTPGNFEKLLYTLQNQLSLLFLLIRISVLVQSKPCLEQKIKLKLFILMA